MNGSVADRWIYLAAQDGGFFEVYLTSLRLNHNDDPDTFKLVDLYGHAGTRSLPWLSWDTLVPHETGMRETYLIRELRKCKLLKIAEAPSVNRFCQVTVVLASNVSDPSRKRLVLLTTYDLKSHSHWISLVGTMSVSVVHRKASQRETETSLTPPFDYGRPGRAIVVDVNRGCAAAVDDLGYQTFVSAMEEEHPNDGRHRATTLRFHLKANITVQNRLALASIGQGLQANSHMLSIIIEETTLSLRDVQHLAMTSKAIRVTVKEETRRRLRKALMPYFDNTLSQFTALLREHGALIGGSTILSILRPGDWTPGDLNIMLPKSSVELFEAFFLSLGYIKHEEEEPRPLRRFHRLPKAFERSSFVRGTKKIDLCWTPNRPPLSCVLAEHSTPVMNYFDGEAVYCLFPEHTFAGKMLRNNHASGPRERREAGIEKLRKRGYVQAGTVNEWIGGEVLHSRGALQLRHLPDIWRQVVDLESA